MEEINLDLSTGLLYLDNEEFDFDLAFSPINQEQGEGQMINKPGTVDDEEVFFGPIGFTEQCVATRAKILQDEDNVKPLSLSPLTGQQCVEIFQEATKIALRLGKLSSTDKVPCEDSPVSSLSKNSSSILKLSSSSESPSWLTGRLSSVSSEGTSLSRFELEFDKENVHPSLITKAENISIHKYDQLEKQILKSNVDDKIDGNFDNENTFHINEPQVSTMLKDQIILVETKEIKTDRNGDIDNGNVQPSLVEENLNVANNEQHMPAILKKITISGAYNETSKSDQNEEKVFEREVAEQKVAEFKEVKSDKKTVVKPRGSILPRPGLRNSKLPKSKNTEKSRSAFNSPIRSIDSSKKRESMKNDSVSEKKPTQAKTQSVEKPTASKSAKSKLQKSVPAKHPQEATKISSRPAKPLAKRKIFNSSEALDKLGTTDCKPKLPAPEQSKIPGPRPRRRRSSSLSSLDSSQSSASSHTSQDDNPCKIIRRPSTKIPTTKVSLASTFGVTRRSKLQDTTADKKPQPLKALSRPGFTSSGKNDKADPKQTRAMLIMPPPSTEQDLKDDKIPLAATPRSSSSLPVARRRSSFKSSLSSTSSREGSPSKYFTPSKPGKNSEQSSSACKRRPTIPTPVRNAPSSASRRFLRSSGDLAEDSMLLPLSPASKPKKNQGSTRQANKKVIPDDDNIFSISSQTVDDLLDNSLCVLEDILPIQPKPIAQSDLIDLSGL